MTEQAEMLEGDKIDISIEQVCAALLMHNGPITIPMTALWEDFGGRQIGLNQNNEDKTLTLFITEKIDLPEIEVVDKPQESE